MRLLLVAAVFVPAERIVPHRAGKPILRPGWLTDILSYFANAVLFAILLKLWMQWGPDVPIPRLSWRTDHWPVAVQAVATIAIGSLIYYWGHRAMHAWRPLWRFHAVHHSSRNLDWLATYRGHVFETCFFTVLSGTAMTMLGLSTPAVGAFLVYRFFEAHIEHSNLRVPLGLLRWVLPSPWFHHWHHATDDAAHNRNFSPYPVWDVLFGTAYMPRDTLPRSFGIDEAVPESYAGQVAFPFGMGARVERLIGRLPRLPMPFQRRGDN
jgi:sterol desaturase/sphingolipid hydroxylase (fatty acid hydroxylase superfamily)